MATRLQAADSNNKGLLFVDEYWVRRRASARSTNQLLRPIRFWSWQVGWVEEGKKRISTHLLIRNLRLCCWSQVANYGIGGRYIPHTDHGIFKPGVELSDMELFRGDRIATFMVYVSHFYTLLALSENLKR